MPLVVPGIQSKDGNSKEEWMTKLMGKKIGEKHDEVVRFFHSSPPFFPPKTAILYLPCLKPTTNEFMKIVQTFAKTDLPEQHRVLRPDSMKTMDFKPDRLNVHVDEDGTVKDVTHG